MSDERRFTADEIAKALTATFEGTMVSDHTWIDSCERTTHLRALNRGDFRSVVEIDLTNGQAFKMTVQELARE